MSGLGLDAWWDEPEYKPCNTLRLRGLFILRKLREHDSTKFHDVMTDLYRDDQPDPQDIGTFEWQTILAFIGASEEEPAGSSFSRSRGNISPLRHRSPPSWVPAPGHNLPFSDAGHPRSQRHSSEDDDVRRHVADEAG